MVTAGFANDVELVNQDAGGDNLTNQVPTRRPVGGRQRRSGVEHDARQEGAGNPSPDLREHQDQHGKPQRGRDAVFQQLQADVTGRELLSRDPGTHDDRHQQSGANEFSSHAARQVWPGKLGLRIRVFHVGPS
jgi:hypothetical protein